MFHLILVILSFLLFFIIGFPFMLIYFLIRLFNPILAAKLAQPAVAIGFRFILLAAGGRLTISGRENIPKDTAVLFASNHRSYFDAVISYTSLPVTHITSFISKKEVRKVPFLSWWMVLLNCKFLDRSNPREGLRSIQSAIADVKNGWSMFIMPEGTRNHAPEMLPFKPGSLKIAERSECPIIPVAITGSDDLLENHMPWIHGGPVTITFGKPILTAGLSHEEKLALPDQVQTTIKEMLAQKASEK